MNSQLNPQPTGWNHSLEDREKLLAFCLQSQRFAGAFSSVEVPENLTHDWLRVEHQGQIGSCQGTELTTGGEVLHFLSTGEQVQLSRLHAFIGTQSIDQKNGVPGVYPGAPTGSTISGGLEYGLKGFVLESDCPYRGDRYPSQSECQRILSIPQDGRFRIRSGFKVESYQHGLQCVAGGMVLSIGTIWDFLIDRDWIVRQWLPQGQSGHARSICEIRNRRLCEVNSWGRDWGLNGRFCWEEAAFNSMLKHPWTVCLALTGDAKPKPRKIDFTKLWKS